MLLACVEASLTLVVQAQTYSSFHWEETVMRKSQAAIRNSLLLGICIIVFLAGAAIIAANLG